MLTNLIEVQTYTRSAESGRPAGTGGGIRPYDARFCAKHGSFAVQNGWTAKGQPFLAARCDACDDERMGR